MEETQDTPRVELRWTAEVGFELDLEAVEDEVSMRMVGVPVPADGTDELRAGPVELPKLDILFKAVVDVSGAPGQLHEAQVQLVSSGGRDAVRFSAKVEDAESGDLTPFQVELPVELPPRAPASGGPRNEALEEDELDWEDEETFEHVFSDVPLSTSETPKKVQRDEDEDERPSPGGLRALLKAIAGAGDEATAEEPDETPEPQPAAPAPEPIPEPPGSPVMSLEDEARSFLRLLIERDALEMVEDHSTEELLSGLAPLLAARQDPDAKARAISGWLLDQAIVEELYIDDESLAILLGQW